MGKFKLSVHPYYLEFERPFMLSYGIRTGTQLAFVKIEFNDFVAYGEASLPPYRNETYNSVKKWVEDQRELVCEILTKNPFENQDSVPFSNQNTAASAALQSAILHWYALSNGKELDEYFQKGEKNPELVITITKNDYDDLPAKLKIAKDFTQLKLKLTGEQDDIEFVDGVRNFTDLPFCTDLNQGFRDKERAMRLITHLEKRNCILVEQPLSAEDHEGHYWLKQRSLSPIIADESICSYDDLLQYYDAYSGVNIKLMKCGGLFQAMQFLRFNPTGTKANGGVEFKKLIGCMAESSLGVSTAAVIASNFEMADLDAPYMTKNDPFEGFAIHKGKVEINGSPRLKKGVRLGVES